MVKKVLILFFFLLGTLSFGAGEYDKDIVVKDQSRNDKVKEVFKAMMGAYEEEDISLFFSYVSEDRFEQDYMTFYDAIDQDIRVYDILNVDTWVDKITEDGIKRYLYVQWDKRYLSSTSDTEIQQRGYSRFLFDEVNGKYKLIQLAGNNFWGKSLPEWTEEVPQIAGQEVYDTASGGGQSSGSGLPDLIISNAVCTSSDCSVTITNNGNTDVNEIITLRYEVFTPSGTSISDIECLFGLNAGDSGSCMVYDQGYGLSGKLEVNPEHAMGIEESSYTNNCWQGNCP